MARKRIELPSADELFGDTGPARPARAAKPKKAVSKKRTTAARSTSAAPKQSNRKGTSGKPSAAPKKPVTASKPVTKKRAPAAGRPAARRAAAQPAAPARNGHGASPELRLSALESRLGTMPVDALIDLRDGLEELLSADVVDEAAVRGLLDSFDA